MNEVQINNPISIDAVKNELIRLFKQKTFLIALGVGIMLGVLHVATVAIPYGMGDAWIYWRSGEKGVYPPSLYNSWLGSTPLSVYTNIYYYLLPLLTCFSIGKNELKLSKKASSRRDLAVRLFAAYLVAGTAAILPLLFNLFATALFVPVLPPEPVANMFPLISSHMLGNLFYERPVLYIAFYLCMTFFTSGVFANLTQVVSALLETRLIALLTPFVLSLALCRIPLFSEVSGYSPINALAIHQSIPNNPCLFIGGLLIIELVVVALLVFSLKRKSVNCKVSNEPGRS